MKRIKLGEVLDIKRGPSLSGKYFSKTGSKIRLTLGNFNYPNGGFKHNISKDDIYYVGIVSPQYILKEGDIITPLTEQVRGLLGSTATIPESNKYIQNGDVALVIPNENLINKRFSYYLISSPIVKSQLDASSQQTKIRHTSPNNIKNCIAYIPSEIKIQEKIANLLDMINLKISHNTKINTQLEELAKTIYDYWFLQFEFPNEEGKPYKSSGGKMVYNEQLKREIPEGWEVAMLSQISNMYQPNTFDAKLLKNTGKYMVYGAGGYMGQYDDYNHEEQEIFISCRGSCGNTYKSMPKSLITGNAMVVHPNNNIIFHYLYLTLIRYGVKQCITGTVQPQITRDNLKDWIFILPPNEILQLFNSKINSMNKKQNNIIYENQELSSLRDFLLPLLMNGQVTFKDENGELENIELENIELENEVEKCVSINNFEGYNEWKQIIGYAARGEADDEILKKIYDAMDDDDKK